MHTKTQTLSQTTLHPSTHEPKLYPDVAKHFEPTFQALARKDLLEKYKHGATKNLNESYHNVIWSMCRKTTFASSTTVNLAVDLAVAQFNVGKSVGHSTS